VIMTSGSRGIKLVNIVLSTACDSPTDAVNDCLNADRMHIGIVATSFFLVAARRRPTVGHYAGFSPM